MPEYNDRSSDWGPLVAAALEKIASKLGVTAAGWDVRVYGEGGDYKVEWMRGDDEEITLYLDGIATLGSREVSVWPLHDRRWVKKLIDQGVHHGIAFCAVEFFK